MITDNELEEVRASISTMRSPQMVGAPLTSPTRRSRNGWMTVAVVEGVQLAIMSPTVNGLSEAFHKVTGGSVPFSATMANRVKIRLLREGEN